LLREPLFTVRMGVSAMGPPRASPRTRFPIAEGLGIFVGIVAWDLLADGQTDLVKAVLIAAPASLAWFALRYWRTKYHDKQN